MSANKSYAIFVERPAKSGQNTIYSAMEVSFDEDELEIAQRVADHINEKRLRPLKPCEVLFKVYTASTAQEAANKARDEGMVYGHIPRAERKDEFDTFKDVLNKDVFEFFGIKPPF